MDFKKYLQDNKKHFEVVLIDKTPHLVHYQVRMVLESQQAHIELLKTKLNTNQIKMSIQEKLRLVSNKEWLDQALKENGINIAQIARSTGLDYDSVYQYTSGKKRMPKTMQSILYLFFEHVMSVEVK